MSLAALPKVELHVHLEGSIDVATAVGLAQAHGLDPADVLPLEVADDGAAAYPARFRDFLHFVELFLAVSRLVRTPDDLATVAAAFAADRRRQGIRWTEVTFTAVTHVRGGMEPRAMWAALHDGLAEGGPSARVGVIVDAVRNLGPAHADETVRLVRDALEAGLAPIVGLGLAGIETARPAHEFVALRAAADELGLGLAVHAGETGSADAVRAAVDDLGADRIGHGIAVVADEGLMARFVRDALPFEVCPSSNVVLGVVGSLDEHPVARMCAAGLNVTVGSDDPPFFATTLTDELAVVARLCGLGRADLAELQRRAARAAFAPAAVRDELLAAIDAWDATGTHH